MEKLMENMEKLNKKPLRKGDLIQLKIENLDTKGRAYGFYDENKIYTNILSEIIGGSMSSRLFQEIREKRGLAYAVYTYNQNYCEGGVISTYIGTNKESYEEAKIGRAHV